MLFVRLVQDDVPDFDTHAQRIRQLTQTLIDGPPLAACTPRASRR
jgi:hypothetical protein